MGTTFISLHCIHKSGSIHWDYQKSLDTQHGRFEKLNKKGKHMGEVDMCLNEKGNQDSSSEHDIRIK